VKAPPKLIAIPVEVLRSLSIGRLAYEVHRGDMPINLLVEI
jgi:hypothetical protein